MHHQLRKKIVIKSVTDSACSSAGSKQIALICIFPYRNLHRKIWQSVLFDMEIFGFHNFLMSEFALEKNQINFKQKSKLHFGQAVAQ